MSYDKALAKLAQLSEGQLLRLTCPGALYDESYLAGTGNPRRALVHADRYPVVIIHDHVSIQTALNFVMETNHRQTPVHVVALHSPIADEVRQQVAMRKPADALRPAHDYAFGDCVT